MVVYRADGVSQVGWYGFSWQELQEAYERLCKMSDKEFVKNLPEAAHFACFVCWLKELGPEVTIGDQGIVHEICHMMHHPHKGRDPRLAPLRKKFKSLLVIS